jgi:hypothetical protein
LSAFQPDRAQPTAVAPIGWWDLADAALFYPDDLPADWRLTYFANAHAAVVVPWSSWSAAGPEAIAGWRDDVHDGFRFYLEQPPTAVDRAQLQRAAEALGDALAAWVAPLASDDDAALPCIGASGGADAPSAGYAVRAPSDVRGNWRAARRWLERITAARGAAPRLVILDRPTSAELSAWHELLLLLGPAPEVGDDLDAAEGSIGSA